MDKLKTLPNFRDLGGIKTKNGALVKPRTLLRSGELNQLCENDKKLLSDTYEVRLIVDFRNIMEAEATPDDVIAGSTYMHINVMKDLDNFNTGLEDLLGRLDHVGVDEDMKEVYKNLVIDPHARQEFGRFVRETAALTSGSCLFHCFAGKDRTGVAAAILLEILGATQADIYEDYLQTNILRQDANQLILTQAQQQGLSAAQATILEQLLLVKEEYLQSMYDTVEQQYGSFANYVTTGLQVSEAEQEQLRNRCLIH